MTADASYAAGTHVNAHHFPWEKVSAEPSAYGRRVVRNEDTGLAEALVVDMIKGRMMLMRRESLNRNLKFSFDHRDTRGDDIAVSGMLSGGKCGSHFVSKIFRRRLMELAAPHALCSSSEHYTKRECVRRRFFDEKKNEANRIVSHRKIDVN